MTNLRIERIESPIQRSLACESIIRALPDWFGIEQATAHYIQSAATCETLAAKCGDQVVGFLTFHPTAESEGVHDSIEIEFMGVLPDYHYRGIGRKLIEELTRDALVHQRSAITVETLDPVVGDRNYLQTFHFYESAGFYVYRRFAYNEANPMVRMRKDL